MVTFDLFTATSIRPVTPEWKKVESPTMPTIFRLSPALAMPWARVMPPPMQRRASRRDSGGMTPRE